MKKKLNKWEKLWDSFLWCMASVMLFSIIGSIALGASLILHIALKPICK